jgi:hypothetical protein
MAPTIMIVGTLILLLKCFNGLFCPPPRPLPSVSLPLCFGPFVHCLDFCLSKTLHLCLASFPPSPSLSIGFHGSWGLSTSLSGWSTQELRAHGLSLQWKIWSDDYHAHTPPEIQDEIDLAEADVQVLRHFISNEEVTDTTQSWVPDPGSTRHESPNTSKPLISTGT